MPRSLLFRNPRIREITSAGTRRWHSHTVKTRQPSASSEAVCSRSRVRVRVSFGSQYSRLDLGNPAIGQFGSGCQCQKHPLTKITARWRGRTKSGLPARRRPCSRKRYPRRCTIERTSNSGFMPRERIWDIHRDRSSRCRLSTMPNHPVEDKSSVRSVSSRSSRRRASSSSASSSITPALRFNATIQLRKVVRSSRLVNLGREGYLVRQPRGQREGDLYVESDLRHQRRWSSKSPASSARTAPDPVSLSETFPAILQRAGTNTLFADDEFF